MAIDTYTNTTGEKHIFQCGACQEGYYLTRESAEQCCRIASCFHCGEPCDQPRDIGHSRCFEASRRQKATVIDQWDGWVFLEGAGDQDGFFESIDNLLECLDEEVENGERQDWPEYAWTCKTIPFPAIDIDTLMEVIAERSFENVEEHLTGVQELREAIGAFNTANAGCVSYEPNYKQLVRVPPRETPTTEDDVCSISAVQDSVFAQRG